MRYELEKVEPIAGISVTAAAPGQDTVMMVSGTLTPETDAAFYSFLDQAQGSFLKPFIEAGGSPSVIDRFLVILRKDQTASVFINEIDVEMKCIVNKALPSGSEVMKSDIIGVGEAVLTNIEIPPDAGVIFFCSVGWRRGLFFDLQPLNAGGGPTDFNRAFGRLYESLLFADLFAIPASLWPGIFRLGWFPFIPLIGGVFESISGFLRRDILSAWEDKVFAFMDESKINKMLEDWRRVEHLERHLPFFERGVEQYLAGDFISSINNVWPRIEGVLRFLYSGPTDRPGQKKILEDVKQVLVEKTMTPETYMPHLFIDYLLAFYYTSFDVPKGVLDVSRHSVAHGVSESEDYSRKKALIGLLIVHQLYYYLKLGWEQKNDSPAEEEECS